MNTLWQCPLLFHLCLKWKINGCSSSYVGRFCLRAINHRLYSWDPHQPTHSSKTISNLKFLREQKAEWWSEERGRRVLTGGWCDWTPSSVKCWTCSQIYKASWGHVSGRLSHMWENYPKRRPEVCYLFFLPLCAWTLQPPELSQRFATDTGRTCYPYYNRSIVHIFESLYCPSCHVSHTSVQHLWEYLLDRKLWHRAEQLAFTNEGNYIYIFISMFFFFLSSPDCNKLRQTRVFMKIIDKQQKCQMSEMPSHK